MDQLKERPALIEQFESILGIAAGGDEDAPIRTADEVESLVIDVTRKLGNSTMQEWAQGAQEQAIEICKKEHPKARLKTKGTLRWWCLFGEVRIEEITLRTGAKHHRRPFAGHAKVSGRCKSLRLERAMCDFGIEDSFASANKWLLEHYGFKLYAGAMRSATLKHAARAELKLKAEYAQPYPKLPAQGPGVVIAEADGSMLCTVPEGLPRKAARPRAWQEIRLLASQRQGSVETTYAATFGSVQEAGVRWGHTAKEADPCGRKPHPVRGRRSRVDCHPDARSLRRRRHAAHRLLPCERIPRRRRARVPTRSPRAVAPHAAKATQARSQRAGH